MDFDHSNHNYLFLDIETLPEGDVDFEQLKTKAELKDLVPKSYTGKKAEEWIEKTFTEQTTKLNEEHRKKSLNSLEGRIFCIGVAINDKPTDIIKYDKDEKIILEQLEAYLDGNLGKDKYTCVWVGHNLKKFDIRWIAHRAMKYRLKNLLSYLPTDKFDKRVWDTNDMFNLYTYGCYDKLDHIAKFFGLEGKVGMDGSQVYDYFLEGKYDEIHDYCKGDVDLTRDIFNIITGYAK